MSTITTVNPATEQEIRTYDVMTEKEVTDRIEACHAAFLEWRELTHQERAPYLEKIGRILRDNSDELATLMTNETGKLLRDGHIEVELCAAICDYTVQSGPGMLADEERTYDPDRKRGTTGRSGHHFVRWLACMAASQRVINAVIRPLNGKGGLRRPSMAVRLSRQRSATAPSLTAYGMAR